MLKRLDLIGFKSFADKTTFTFGDGITAVVGPNGSGKSNIVDAVRWILGEQSAKSLRGGEMADVIFNGSTSRRSFGMAEVTMTFDNAKKLLSTEAEEVQVTRRVYRDGQGEYLINGQITRLKDIKDLFLGSGAGHDAYCIIEQGKVDVLLQASTRERRIIFEEAAGISRFRAKKTETLRKLERVDQNLQRLRDIIDEVEKQLRSVKLQASKALRYQEYSTRLKELRIGLGLQEYHELSEKLKTDTELLDKLRAELEERAARANAWETDMQQLDARLADIDDRLRQQEEILTSVREHIKTHEATLLHEGNLTGDLETDLSRTRKRLLELSTRVGALSESYLKAREEYLAADNQAREQRQEVNRLEEHLGVTVARLEELHRQIEADKAEHLEQMRQAAHRQNDAVAAKAQVDNLRREHDRLNVRATQAVENLTALDLELQELCEADQNLQNRLAAARQTLTDLRQEREQVRQTRDQMSERVSQLRQQKSGLASRIEVLQGLIRTHEGLGTGVKEVFQLLEQTDPGPWSTVLGIIADFLTVRREYAASIDLALGDWAQRFLVRDLGQLVAALRDRPQPFSGRVSFLPLQVSDDRREASGVEEGLRYVDENGESNPLAAPHVGRPHRGTLLRLLGDSTPGVDVSVLTRMQNAPAAADMVSHPGVVALAEHVVSCDHPELVELPAQLLGRTLIVQDLETARALASQGGLFRMVTLQGELLEPDGTLTVGPPHAAAGFLARKSELQELQDQQGSLDAHIAAADQALNELRERLANLDTRLEEHQEEIQVLAEQSGDLRSRLNRHQSQRQGLHEEVSLSRDEILRIEQDIGQFEMTWHTAQEQAAAAEAQVQLLHERIHETDHTIRGAEQERQLRQQACTNAHIALAKIEERVSSLSLQHDQLESDVNLARQELTQGEKNVASARTRLTESQRAMLEASAALAQGFLDKEAAQHKVTELINERDGFRRERMQLAQQAQSLREEWRQQQEKVHAQELETNDLRHRRDTLADRLREDYQVELSELYRLRIADCGLRIETNPGQAALSPDAQVEENPQSAIRNPQSSWDATAVNQEIAELRKKLSRLGSVNLDSLTELSELETRATSQQAQFDDLTSAKKSLEDIINKINLDSRRMFSESFQTIRTHFQELFRKLFGGGMADIVFEDENDILESGIEIIARPPGKELRSISLMSGGEKTMTAVALLMAIFRSKPSPFCILDEVDAALDEANIERFTNVVREFLDRSQFIIVTHSKKTMACADVLYGITMQESGISKQVSVRFEDWPNDAQPSANGDGSAEVAGQTR
jgi:chromosome segregation protein